MSAPQRPKDPNPRDVRAAAHVAEQVRDRLQAAITFSDPTDVDIVTLWILGTYVYDAFTYYPYLLADSDNGGVGKSTLGRVLHSLMPNSNRVDAASVPAIVRLVRDGNPLILDEFDNLLDSKTTDAGRLNSILNSGYHRNGTTVLCEPDGGTGRTDSVYHLSTGGPKVLLGLVYHAMKPTLRQRCIPITLEEQTIEDFRLRAGKADESDTLLLAALRKHFPPLSQRIHDAIRHDHDLPNGVAVYNRSDDLWHPLFAVADVLGVEWLARAYIAAQRHIVDERGEQTTGVDLLDQALQRALRERRLRATNYSDPQTPPLPSGRFGLGNEDFGWPDDRRQAFAGLSLVFDRRLRRAELRWKAPDTSAVIAAINHGRTNGERFTDAYLRKTYDHANRLRRTASHRTMPESMHPGEPQQTLIILDVSNWAWHWPDPTEEMP